MIRYTSKSVCGNALQKTRAPLAAGVRAGFPAARKRLYLALLLALPGAAQALPEGGEVVAGEASITVNGDVMNVQQDSQRTIINFQSFDVAGGQTVNFRQPSSDAVALNRVLGSNLSEIHGAINANGQVYLINPNGVLFGNGAQLDVGSLVVTTLDIDDQDFLSGHDSFAGGATGTVENRGAINAQGRVVLLAPDVINRGDIQVPGGDITLRASQQALLHAPGSEIPILVDSSDFIGQVTNEGNLRAGNVALVLDGAEHRNVYDSAINNSGLVRAVRATGSGGRIQLHAAGSSVINSGTLDASAQAGDGGAVTIESAVINQSGRISAVAAGTGDGGTISLRATDSIAMHSGSQIDASADRAGNAGDAVVIAKKATWFTEDASINARGGAESGDGGFVEVSGLEFVSVAGSVDVGATHGDGGLWFIDPTDITITANLDANGTFSGSNPATWTPTGTPTTALINVTTLRNTLSNDGDVLISSATGGTGLGDITFDAALDYNGIPTRTLTLQAQNRIIFTDNGRIYDADTVNGGGINLVATANTGLTMASGARITVGSGTISLSTAAGDATITGLASNSTANNAVRVEASMGRILDANVTQKDIDVGDGGFVLRAMGDIGDLAVESNLLDVVSTTGNITIHEEASTSVLRLETPGTATIYTGSQFSVDLATAFNVNNLVVDAGTDFRVADTGFSVTGDLTVTANTVRGDASTVGSGTVVRPVILSAANANITLRNGTLARYWTTSFDQLALNLSGGTGAFELVDTDGLALTSVTTGGNASFTTTNADLVLTIAPTVAGSLSLTTTGSGNLVLPNSGLSHAAGLTVLADNIIDSDSDVTLAATNANITLRDGTLPARWTTSFDQLTLNITGVSALELTDANGLTLNSISTAGSASFSTTNANLVVAAAPAIGGSLGLNTIGSGNVVIPDAGLSYTGNLSVVADNLVDSDSNLTLAAANADITLRDGTAARNWTTSLNQLALNLASTGSFSLTDANGLTLTSVATGGNASFTTTNANLVLTTGSAVAGGLVLTASGSGDLVLPNTGLTHSGNLTVLADNLRDTDGNIALSATTADITLRAGTVPSSWAVDFDQLVLSIAGSGALSLTDSDGLTVTSATTGGNASFATTNANLVLTAAPNVTGDLGLSTVGSGNIIIPTTRFTHSGGALVIDADDLLDTDRTLTLQAASADITLRNPGGHHSWATEFGALDLVVAGVADIDLTDESGLSLGGVTVNGNAGFATTNANLVLTTAATVANNLSLSTLGSGNVVIPDAGLAQAGNLTVLADNLIDSDSTLTLGATNANITLRAGAAPTSWAVDFDQLVLSIAGSGALSLTDSDGLTLTSVATGGNASFATTNANLVLTAAPNVAGDLGLSTVGSGNIIIPTTRFTHSGGALVIDADDLLDTDRTLTLQAASADITLRNPGGHHSWATEFGALDLVVAGVADIDLTDETGLSLGGVTVNGNAGFATTNANLVLTTAATIANNLSLSTLGSGNVVIPDAGLAQAGNLTVLADNLIDSDSTLTLGATNADITLRDGNAATNWNTSFGQLALNIAGTGAYGLTDSDGLTLTSSTTGGNASFASTNADLALTAAPNVTGSLSLSTLGSGNVVIPDAGLAQAGNLTVLADNLIDADSTLTLGATNADITLRDGNAATTWSTSFDQLVLNMSGIGAFTLTDSDGLTVTSATTGGNASFATTNANLVLTAAPNVTGGLSLSTLGSGNVVIPDAGLAQAGNLTVLADNLMDSDSTLTLGAANATITLRDGTAAATWNTSFGQLALNIAGAGAFGVIDSDGLTVTSATTGGNTSFATTNADLVLASAPTVAGNLNLTTSGSGDLVLPTTGLSHAAGLTVLADNIIDSDSDVILGATNANIMLRGGTLPARWTTSFDQLTLNITGVSNLELTDTNGLTLNSVSTAGSASFSTTNANLVVAAAPAIGGNLGLNTVGSGNLVIPDSGLSYTGNLSVVADNLVDRDSNLTLAAANADITLRDGTATRNWTTSLDQLALNLASTGSFSLIDANGLTLTSVATGGNASFTTTNANLVLASGSAVAGDLVLTASGSGDLVLPNTGFTHSGNLTVLADNLRDTDASIALSATNADITLRDGATTGSWATDFDHLVLSVAGAGALSLVDSDGLTLSSATTGGNASFATTNADLVLTATPSVAGDLSLGTLGSGNLIIPDAGLTQSGALTIAADSVRDSDNSLILVAQTLNATLRNQQSAANWSTTLDSLDLSLSGGGALTFGNTGSLAVTSLTSDGATTLNSTGNMQVNSVTAAGNLTLASGGDLSLANATLGANLQVTTAPTGTLVIPDAGLALAGDVVVDAGRVASAGGAANTRWTADAASFRLRDTNTATTLDIQAGDLSMLQDTAANLTLHLADAARISALESGGDVRVQSPGDLTLSGSNFAVVGELAFAVDGSLQLSAAGLTVSNDLRINAANLSTSGGGSPLLAGRNADLTLTGSQPLALTTRLDRLGITYAAAGPFSLDNDRDLTLTRFTAPAAETLEFAVNGSLILPDSGLTALQRLTINALDLRDSDRNLTLAAPQLAVQLTGASGNNAWAVTADELDVLMRGNASVTVTDAGGLILTDLNGDGQAVLVENGNFGVNLASGDLAVASNVSAADLTDDNIRAGVVDLAVAQGSLLTQGPVLITSSNTVDQDVSGDSHGIRFRLTDLSSTNRAITLGATTQLRAIGGDILIDTRLPGTATAATRNFVQASGSSIEAYNSIDEAEDGLVMVNGESVAASPGQVIRSGRTLALIMDVQKQQPIPDNIPDDIPDEIPDNILDEVDELDGTTNVGSDTEGTGPNAAAQFDMAFGTCDELEKNSARQCRVNAALKAFLSHWLVGGEMPPKTEIR